MTRLRIPFAVFRHQLLSLLGVPSLPPGVEFDGPGPFSDWQLDALVRHRARENMANAKETLKSIIALVNQIDNMPVGQDVRGDVQGALTALDNVRPQVYPDHRLLNTESSFVGYSCIAGVLNDSPQALEYSPHTLVPRILQPRNACAAVLPRGAQIRGVHAPVRFGGSAPRCRRRSRACRMAKSATERRRRRRARRWETT